MYRQLLYSAGGGIISNKHKAEQAECVTLAIGLGGTGIDCLRNLKRQVYETVKPDNPDDPNPIYSHIKFLAVDSDRSSMRDDGMINPMDEKREFFDISSPSIPHVSNLFKRIAERPEYQWLNEEIPYSVTSDQRKLETNGTRQIGRLLLMMKSDAFVSRIASLIMDALRGLPEGVDINVHIFSGLCGGTGSGIFLDVCYLVQRALRYHGNDRTAVFGYFFLPDVNLNIPSIRAYQNRYGKLSQNGYAAMKELDYCMNFETNGGEWDQEYRGFHIGPTKNPPVNVCHLISSRTMHGDQLKNAYACALNAVCDYVMQFLTKNSGFFQNRKRLFNALWEKIDKYYELDLKITMLERMCVMIPRMIDQLIALFDKRFEPYCKVYSELLDTSAENSLAMRIGAMVLRDPCTVRIPELNFQTMRQLDQTLGNLDFDREASRFNRAFFNAEDVWARGEESRIVKFVSDYVSGVFDEYFSKTIERYLEMQFGTTDASVLEDMAFNDILAPLSYKTLPLFWINGFYSQNYCKRDLVFIPDTSVILHKAMVIHSDGDPFLNLVKSSSPYRINRLNCLFGVPMFVYYGTDIYKEIYQHEDSFKGFHIYEGAGKDSRDWRKLPDLVPFSITDKTTEEMLQNEKMYKRAVDAGIIRMRDNGAWELAVYEEPEDLERFAEEAFNGHDSRAAYGIPDRTEHYLHSRMPVRTMFIPNGGAAGFEDRVRLDYVMSSPALLKEIKRQLDILDKVSSIKSRAEAFKKDEAMKEEYFYALFTGIIYPSSRKMVYMQTKDGVSREIVLSSVSPKEPYWRYAQIYQGLLDYMELDDQIRAAIKEEVSERLEEFNDYEEYEEEIRAACNRLEELLADPNERARRYGRFIIRIPEMPPELEEFFVEMMWILWEFRDGYGV